MQPKAELNARLRAAAVLFRMVHGDKNQMRIEFRCPSCGALNEGEEHEFVYQHTMPPTWEAQCAWCHRLQSVSPRPLIAKLVNNRNQYENVEEVLRNLERFGRSSLNWQDREEWIWGDEGWPKY
jgi:hypothetical protein